MKIGLFHRMINLGIRTWARLMTIVRFPAYFKGKEPFRRNREQVAFLRTNFLGGYLPKPQLPGTTLYWGKGIHSYEKDGKPVKVSLEDMTLDSQVPFREDSYQGTIGFQVIYRIPGETKALEKYGRELGNDPEKIREPLNSVVLQAIQEAEKSGDRGSIQKKAIEFFEDEKTVKDFREKYGIIVEGVSVLAPQYDKESQEIIMNTAKAQAEAKERVIMAHGIELALQTIYSSVKNLYKQNKITATPEKMWRQAIQLYNTERYHSMTQNPGATVIVGSGSYPGNIIPMRGRRTSEPADQPIQ